MLQGAILSIFGLSGTGVYPQCSSYDVPITDSHPAEAPIGFCAQPAGSSHALVKLASMRPYPVDVTYPAGTSVSPGVLSRIIAPGPGRAILTGLDHLDAVLPLSPGNSTQITVRLDGAALAAGLVGVAETLASKLGGKPKAILDAFENAKCFTHAIGVLDSVTDPTLAEAQDAGSTILECAGQALGDSKAVAAMVGTAVIFAASLVGDAIFAAWGIIDKLMRNSDHVLTVQRSAPATSCPSAAVIMQALAQQENWWRPGYSVPAADITCAGPYIVAGYLESPQIGARVLLEQGTPGLKVLTSGSGPLCTTIAAYAQPGQVIEVPKQYGHALDCIN
jgi:hypothetical protein